MKFEKTNLLFTWLRYAAVLVSMTLLLNGCAPKRQIPIPVPEYPEHPSTPRPVPVPPPSPGIYSPTLGPAKSLYHAAQRSLSDGDTQKAELTMERALRIEPRNGHYWYTMAKIKYEQQQYAQTIQLCLKSKSLAGRNQQLLTLNDSLIGKARGHIQ